jgi:hypothetical protein
MLLVNCQSIQFFVPQGYILHWYEHFLFIPSTFVSALYVHTTTHFKFCKFNLYQDLLLKLNWFA